MASSSHNTFEGVDDESFDQYFDQHFDQAFQNFAIASGAQEERKKRIYIKRNREKAMYVYGTIISVKLQLILIISSGDDLE